MVSIDFARIKADIVTAAIRAVNDTLYHGEERAREDVPVRKVFKGGRQVVRFKTASEIEQDKDMRARLGFAPEMLATPKAVAKVRAAGRSPMRSLKFEGKEFGFARTIEHPVWDPRRNKAGKTRAERGLTENRGNRANTFAPGNFRGDDAFIDRRELNSKDERHLKDENTELLLTSRGRAELKSGRAVFQRRKEVATVEIEKGEVRVKETNFVSVGPPRLGGGLLGTIRVVLATRNSYPVIEGWLVAGDSEHKYAIHQELGNRHNPAHPFLRPRLPEWREELPAQLRRALGRTSR